MMSEDEAKRVVIYIQRIYGTLVLDYMFDKELCEKLKEAHDSLPLGTRRSAFMGQTQ